MAEAAAFAKLCPDRGVTMALIDRGDAQTSLDVFGRLIASRQWSDLTGLLLKMKSSTVSDAITHFRAIDPIVKDAVSKEFDAPSAVHLLRQILSVSARALSEPELRAIASIRGTWLWEQTGQYDDESGQAKHEFIFDIDHPAELRLMAAEELNLRRGSSRVD
jgi:hypothetical protein